VQDVSASVSELRRAVIELGHVGGTIPPNVAGRDLDDPAFAPLFDEATRLDAPLSVHWGNGSHLHAAGTDRFDTHFMVHALGHPVEQMIALACVLTGGVLDEHPTLRIGFLEAGCGWTPYWVERLEDHYERRGAELPRMKRAPSEYLAQRRCFVTAEPAERLLPQALTAFGDGCVLFASDYPHSDSAFPHAVSTLRGRQDVPDDEKPGLFGGNALAFYGPRLAGRRRQ
jgi:predicted TIM-barrel fold metal-dependent hydrolase